MGCLFLSRQLVFCRLFLPAFFLPTFLLAFFLAFFIPLAFDTGVAPFPNISLARETDFRNRIAAELCMKGPGAAQMPGTALTPSTTQQWVGFPSEVEGCLSPQPLGGSRGSRGDGRGGSGPPPPTLGELSDPL